MTMSKKDLVPHARLASHDVADVEPAMGPDTAPILTVDELADLLRLNRKTVYDAIKAGEIPGVRRIGTRYRISRSAVLSWLAEGHGRVSPKRRRK